MSIAAPISSDPPEKAQMDTLNPGVLNADGSRQAPPFSMQVDDCMYANTKEFILQTAGISIVSLEDIAGKIHPNMKGPFSVEKWNRIYSEYQLLVGHKINSRRMVVIISAIRKKKILLFLVEENWITAGHKKTIRQICSVLGILNSAAEYFPWAEHNYSFWKISSANSSEHDSSRQNDRPHSENKSKKNKTDCHLHYSTE